MRNLKKVLLAMLLVVGVVFLVPKDANAATKVEMTKTARDGFIIEWPIPNLNNIEGYYVKDMNTGKYIFNKKGNWRGVSFTASPGYVSRYAVYCVYNNGNSEYYLGTTYVNTTPADISTKSFGLYYVYNDGGI